MEGKVKEHIFLNILLILLCEMKAEGSACTSADFPVLTMCQSGRVTGKGVYLDTSNFTGLDATCTCTMEPESGSGVVTFDPVVVDNTSCETSILLDEYNFVHGCSSDGDRVGHIAAGASVDITVTGRERMQSCVKLHTNVTDMTLGISCYESVRVTTTPSTTSTTSQRATTTSSTDLTSTVKSVDQEKACPTAGISVLNMCESQTAEAWRLYIDTSLFSTQYTSCSCTIGVVSQAGGLVTLYPSVVDSSNCQTNIYIDMLSFTIGCTSRNSAKMFFNQSSTIDMLIKGTGAAQHCVMVQASATDVTLRIQCSRGILKVGSTDQTTSGETTFVSSTGTSTTTDTADITTPTTTPGDVTLSTLFTTNMVSTTSASTASGSPFTETSSEMSTSKTSVIPSPSSTSSLTSSTTSDVFTTTEETTLLSTTPQATTGMTSTADSGTFPQQPSSDSTYSTTLYSSSEVTSSTTTASITTASPTDRGTEDEVDAFPVTEVVVGISVGVVVILFITAFCICYKHRKEKEDMEEQKQNLYGPRVTTQEMCEIDTVTLDNPVYYHDDKFSTIPRLSEQPGQSSMTDRVTSPNDFSDLYATVNKHKNKRDTSLLY